MGSNTPQVGYLTISVILLYHCFILFHPDVSDVGFKSIPLKTMLICECDCFWLKIGFMHDDHDDDDDDDG